MDFFKEFLISNAIGLILSTVKNEESKVRFRRAFLKIFNSIKAAYPGDSEFE